MRKILSVAIALALPAAALASDTECLVSFAGAQLDVCYGKSAVVAVANASGLDHLLLPDAVSGSELRLVKFDGPITKARRQALEAVGAKIIDYAPHYAFVVHMPPALDKQVMALEGVVWAGGFPPALKIDPNLYRDMKGAQIGRDLGVDALVVSLDPHADLTVARAGVAAVAGFTSVREVSVGGQTRLLASFDPDSIDADTLAGKVTALALQSNVLGIGYHRPKRTYNSQAAWLHQSGIGPSSPYLPVFDHGIYGCGQIVGELDTGLYQGNNAFNDPTQTTPVAICNDGASCAAIATPNTAARKVIAYYKWSGDSGSSWADEHGHGTHVAGSILGNDNVSNPGVDCVNYSTPGGRTNLDGGAPGAKLVMQETGSDLTYLNDQGGTPYHAAQIAYENGARLHSNSWGGGCTNIFGMCVSGCEVTYDETARDADRVMSDYDDLLLVFAAGNDDTACPNGNNVGSPGNAKNVLTVGATLRGSSADGMASFSSRGPTLDARIKPDVSAQGNSIVSAGRSTSGTATMSGTSMATPTTTGLVALVREYLQRGFYPSGTEQATDAITDPSGALLKGMMIAGTTAMSGSGAGTHPGQDQGWGRVLLDNVLHFDGDQRTLFLQDGKTGLQAGEQDEYFLTVLEGEPLQVVLTWSDVAAALNASPATVNQLRLEVQAPDDSVWTQKLPSGYSVDNATPFQDASTSGYDPINTVHRISFAAPQTGLYRVRVRGINVPDGPQPYAVVATGKLAGSADPDFVLSATPSPVLVCAGAAATINVGVVSLGDYVTPVALSALGLPAGATPDFSVNPVTPALPPAQSVLSLETTPATPAGSHAFLLEGVSGALTRTANLTLDVDAAVPAGVTVVSPASGSVDVATSPTFSWDAVADADGYRIQVSADGFATTVIDEVVTTGTSLTPTTALSPDTAYAWRVTASNACGEGVASEVATFRTANLICRTVNMAIPDGSAAGLSDAITITDASVLTGLTVSVKANHTWVGDLKFTLSHDATSVVLVDRPGVPTSSYGCSGDNVDIVLDDTATADVETMCNSTPPALSGPVKPSNPMAPSFAGQPFAGTWTLNVSDNAGSDTGTLLEWCLMPTLDAPEEPLEPEIFKDGFE